MEMPIASPTATASTETANPAAAPSLSKSSTSSAARLFSRYHFHIVALTAYFAFGLLHELTHVAVAWIVTGGAGDIDAIFNAIKAVNVETLGNVMTIFVRALFGRYSLVDIPIDAHTHEMEAIIRHSGWIVSWIIAMACHFQHVQIRNKSNPFSTILFSEPIVILAAYITAMEAMSTDLFGFVPATSNTNFNNESDSNNSDYQQRNQQLLFFCGNFGILLLNSSWINIDGGKKALDMLEKMVNVTMMRGAQSGGVVTYEPSHYSVGTNLGAFLKAGPDMPPILRGIRSRVVNAKRTDLSKGVRHKIVKDNCTPTGKLRGWDKIDFNSNGGSNANESRLVRGFFGHTRFATSSKASMDGTHPHQWCAKRMYRLFPFKSSAASASKKTTIAAHSMPVEKYITHNGDFEFYKIHGKYYDTEDIQKYLVMTLHEPMPATVDSAAIAGMMDLIRCQGCFALSARYALCFEVSHDSRGSGNPMDPDSSYPVIEEYEEMAKIFEQSLIQYVEKNGVKSLEDIANSSDSRTSLASETMEAFRTHFFSASKNAASSSNWVASLSNFVSLDAEEAELMQFIQATVNAFFDNDLLNSVRVFLENAKGSFGLSVSTSMDAHRQVCFAAKGQTLSVAFYPRKGCICFGSEQAAVKAGLNFDLPKGKSSFGTDYTSVDEDAVRLDLDDLGGEICLLDWGYGGDSEPSVSLPNRSLQVNKLMGGSISVVLCHQNHNLNAGLKFSKRLVQLENNEFVKPLLNDSNDPVLTDIRDIPRICANIQKDWADVGLNRMTAWNLSSCLRARLRGYIDGSIESHASQVDILVTGCEVSLWVAEQFIADLRKCFPKLYVKAVSSNKLLGLFGQELSMPAIGFEYTQKTLDMKDPIVIIVSHSGGTFGPLACSNLLQSFSNSIFCVSSEWDTQVGKQLRSMYTGKNDLLCSRIFSTEVGVRPAEPCSVSVVATHQLLTNIFEHICITIISDPHMRHVTGAIINERDLQTLERCNRDNIKALEDIVGRDRNGTRIHKDRRKEEIQLRAAGNLWSEHILENVKAYIMSFIYIFATVTSGHPLISGIATAAGLEHEWAFYITRFFDACIYFWLPQINIFILRLIQGRNLRHRMVGRTVAIGDPCPWVAQSAEAFLSKIFACSYSIAGLGVISGNPADHLVHRHTHRVVRGTLLVCGRPDGRLTALTTLEASTCLAVNQASSIQSIGGTCESITIGHNRSKLPLTKDAIYLPSHRPKFLCEQVLSDLDDQEKKASRERKSIVQAEPVSNMRRRSSIRESIKKTVLRSSTVGDDDDNDSVDKGRSSANLLGVYANLEKEAKEKANEGVHDTNNIDYIIKEMIKETQSLDKMRQVFNEIDEDGSGELDYDEFLSAFKKINPDASIDHLQATFEEADIDGSGTLDFNEFKTILQLPNTEVLAKLGVKNRDDRGLVQVQASEEKYFGEELLKTSPKGFGQFAMSQTQHLVQELYESRIASMQRFVAMTVMFHQMGMRVQTFFPKISFGLLGYNMDRTHSIMRIATTASPVSGADVRDRMIELKLRGQVLKAVRLVSRHWKAAIKTKQEKEMRKSHHKSLMSQSSTDSKNVMERRNSQ